MMFGRYGNSFGPEDGAWGCFGNGFFGYGFMGPLMMLGFILITALVVYLILKSNKKQHTQNASSDALNLLQLRYVKGEITEEEYLQKKNLLNKQVAFKREHVNEEIKMLKKIKAAFQRLIENIGEQNKSQYGSQGINCCDLNKKK